MLDINQLDDLSAKKLYALEVRAVEGTREEETQRIERARTGNKADRNALIERCLCIVHAKAYSIYDAYRPLHVDVLDLVQEANLKMLECLDRALEKNDPVAYLVAVAYNKIYWYCKCHTPLIQKPERSQTVLAKRDPYPATTESFDGPGNQRIKVELIEAPALKLEVEQEQEEKREYQFAPLYEAVKRLPRTQRATIVRLCGLFGQPAETIEDIAESSHVQYDAVQRNNTRARNKLRQALSGELARMLLPKPAREEEEE